MTVDRTKVAAGQEIHPLAVQKIGGPPPETRNNRTVASAAVVQNGMDAGQCAHFDTTSQAQKEGAIIALRAGVETLFASMKPSLRKCLSGLDSTIDRIFDRREYRAAGQKMPSWARPVEYAPSYSPLKRAERSRIGVQLDAMLDAAEASGLDRKAMWDAVYAPLWAYEEAERLAFREAAARIAARKAAGRG
jgi:hypothetical protein